ncbi:MAG: PhoH family protein [Flavobacteriales bacterium]|nr:PhoH family protein [Flavobacteriales bacterium]
MTELVIQIDGIELSEFYGENNAHFKKIKEHFPKLKIVGRDRNITVNGEEQELLEFEKAIKSIIQFIGEYNHISVEDLEKFLTKKWVLTPSEASGDDILVHGVGGKKIKAKTPNLRKLVRLSESNDMVFAIGPAGTGKTYTGVALAVRALKNREVKRIVLTRPAVEAGESLGFLPGDLKEKLDPYLQPLYDALKDMIPMEKLSAYIEKGIIEVAPLAFMRGRTLDEAFVILDEAQNTTHSQMKMFLTRMGKNAKFIVTGDPSQIDLPINQKSGLKTSMKILNDTQGIGFIYLDDSDVVRHPLVRKILQAYAKNDVDKR